MKSFKTLALISMLATAGASAQTHVTSASFGSAPDGSPVTAYTLKDATLQVKLITWGARAISIRTPDATGHMDEVILGADSLKPYVEQHGFYLGATAGRYANRIAKGRFTLDGKAYQTSTNDHGNTLHGGTEGFDQRNWKARVVPNGVELTLVSADGDQGFPGQVTAHVRYTLRGHRLQLDYSATTTAPTVINLTNHSYFNLAGKGDVLDHVLQIRGSAITSVSADLIPTGKMLPVAGTPFDFTQPQAIGTRLHQEDEQLKRAGGYDHNYVLASPRGLAIPAAELREPHSGRTLKIFTTEPGIQFYSGNFLDGSFVGRAGAVYSKYTGLCLETQHFPDSPNQPTFPSTAISPSRPYKSTTILEFSTQAHKGVQSSLAK